jgi:hypothetical protein
MARRSNCRAALEGLTTPSHVSLSARLLCVCCRRPVSPSPPSTRVVSLRWATSVILSVFVARLSPVLCLRVRKTNRICPVQKWEVVTPPFGQDDNWLSPPSTSLTYTSTAVVV